MKRITFTCKQCIEGPCTFTTKEDKENNPPMYCPWMANGVKWRRDDTDKTKEPKDK